MKYITEITDLTPLSKLTHQLKDTHYNLIDTEGLVKFIVLKYVLQAGWVCRLRPTQDK